MRESWDRLEEKHEVELARCRKRVGELEQLEKERSELELQRKAEIESLRENLQKYLIVADFAYDWEYWLGPDRKCLYISLSVERITGYSTDDFICNPDLFEQIVHPDDRHAVAGHLDECLRESSKQCAGLEFRVITKDNTEVWIEHRCQPVYLADGTYGGRRSSNRDITSRKQIEERLQTNERQLRAILESSTEAIFLMDKHGKLLIANKVTADRLKTDWETLKKGSIYDFIPPDVAGRRRKNVQKVIETGKPVRFEDERSGRTMLNSIYPIIEKDGKINHLAIFGMDITEEKQTQKALQESEARYRLLAENASDVIWTVDLEMRLTYVSPSVKNLLGLTPEEAMSRSMTDAYTKESFEKAMQVFFEEMAIEGSVQADANRTRVVGLELIHKDGRIIPAEGNFCFLRDLEGHAVGILSIVRDIRERKQAEETREKLILELRDALSKIKKLSGMLPICATCKKIRDDKGYWNQIESYIKDNSEAEFSHGICPECAQRLYQTFLDKQ